MSRRDGEDGGEFFERGVAGALADAVDGAFDLADAGFDGGDGVGDGEAEVVVAVGGEDDVFDAGDAGADHAEHLRRSPAGCSSRRCRGG